MHATPHEALAHAHLWQLIRRVRVALLTSRGADGALRARALGTQNTAAHADRVLYFFVAAAGGVADDLPAGGSAPVNIVYTDPAHARYVSISGRAALRRDPPLQAALWTARTMPWFPGGALDPDLRLLEVQIDEAEYWDLKCHAMLHRLRLGAMRGLPPPAAHGAELSMH